jgi:hypothetical protein
VHELGVRPGRRLNHARGDQLLRYRVRHLVVVPRESRRHAHVFTGIQSVERVQQAVSLFLEVGQKFVPRENCDETTVAARLCFVEHHPLRRLEFVQVEAIFREARSNRHHRVTFGFPLFALQGSGKGRLALCQPCVVTLARCTTGRTHHEGLIFVERIVHSAEEDAADNDLIHQLWLRYSFGARER